MIHPPPCLLPSREGIFLLLRDALQDAPYSFSPQRWERDESVTSFGDKRLKHIREFWKDLLYPTPPPVRSGGEASEAVEKPGERSLCHSERSPAPSGAGQSEE